MKKILALAALWSFAYQAHAGPPHTIKSVTEIKAILTAMPVHIKDGTRGNALQRIRDLGLALTRTVNWILRGGRSTNFSDSQGMMRRV